MKTNNQIWESDVLEGEIEEKRTDLSEEGTMDVEQVAGVFGVVVVALSFRSVLKETEGGVAEAELRVLGLVPMMTN